MLLINVGKPKLSQLQKKVGVVFWMEDFVLSPVLLFSVRVSIAYVCTASVSVLPSPAHLFITGSSHLQAIGIYHSYHKLKKGIYLHLVPITLS